jgi:drug/metabolite transporter (DMT)-like permease
METGNPTGIYEKGIILALITALISGVSVFVNGAAVKLADPIAYTLLKNFGALVFLGAIALAFHEMKNFRSLSTKQWGMLVLIGIIGGSLPFAMFFAGLKLGGAAASSFIFRSLFVFAGVFGYVILKEKLELRDIAAGFIMLAGSALLISGTFVFGFGEALVLAATALWALEYTISRKALADISPRVLMVSRMLFGSLALFCFLATTGSIGTLLAFNAEILGWVAITSLLLFGFVSAWYSALKHIPVFKATAILALGGIVTAALDLGFSHKIPSFTDALGLCLMLVGAISAVGAVAMMRSLSKTKEIVPSLIE